MKSILGNLLIAAFALTLFGSDAIAGPFGRRGGRSGGCSSGSCGTASSCGSGGCASCGQAGQNGGTCADGTCPGGVCTPACTGYQWVPFADDSSQVALMLDGKQVGNFIFATRSFHRLKSPGHWERNPSACPCCDEEAKKTSRANCPGCDCGCASGGPCACGAVAHR